jgi:hypothetical protein
MSKFLSLTVLFLLYATSVFADVPANVNVHFDNLMAKGLLTITGVRGVITPSFKFFDQDKLVGFQSGAPTLSKPLQMAINTIPSGLKILTLKEELTSLPLGAPVKAKTLLIYTMNRNCPPCDGIIGRVKNQLPQLGWADANLLVVNITE